MTESVEELLGEYAEFRRREERKPYWMNLAGGTAWSGELRYELEHYSPEAHYRKAISEKLEQKEPVPDGGSLNLHRDGRRSTVYYWIDPDTGAALYHTEVNGEEADPFFGSVGEAEGYLEKRSDTESEDYEGMSLYRARVEKVEDAVEVLMDQAGIGDF